MGQGGRLRDVPLKMLLVENTSKESHSVAPDLLERGHEVIVAHSPHKAPSMAVDDWPDLIDGAL